MLPRYVVYDSVKVKHPSRLVFTSGMGIPQLTVRGLWQTKNYFKWRQKKNGNNVWKLISI